MAITEWLNRAAIFNRDVLYDALEKRPKHRPLITVANHISCFDEPLLWGMLRMRHYVNTELMRWSASAAEICFDKYRHRLLFSLGKSVPIVRGDGVYQRGVDFMLEKLNEGRWAHMFPEGKVNLTKEVMRLKWGVGRLISECKVSPIVIPIWITGMDDVLPNKSPYIPKYFKKVTIYVGDPMDFEDVRLKMTSNDGPMEQRKLITDMIQCEFARMKPIAEKLHIEGGGVVPKPTEQT
ncbi:PREDICTED: tafazzin-like [Priapulus caudatus]|uniref:Tafazzin family protein n=1 Tax=Priapulus caudatus TaxID=37621 RepID=A0ABM1F1D7_PRICU|nr:PREDICTED: tafazzin-like [Priapulus caudatus]